MTAANVKNNHTSPLGVGGVTIDPGKSARVENWHVHSQNKTTKLWLEGGFIEASEAKGAVPPALPGLPGMTPPKLTEDERKQQIIEELQTKHGITKTMRSSLDNLEKALADANG